MPARRIERDSEDPPYQQLYVILRDQITAGELQPGSAVPSLTYLMQDYGVARTTARKAIALLTEHQLVRVVQGWRTTVRERKYWKL
jgi:DNA-binding GntR family transcriptional regulator